MKILVLNCGSSSVKYKLFDMDSSKVLGQGSVEKIGLSGSYLKLQTSSGERVLIEEDFPEYTKSIQFIFKMLTESKYACIKSLKEIDAVGHRVVHGGEKFSKSVRINDEVLRMVNECIDLAPLHNPPNLKGIEAVSKLMPDLPQVAVFDTGFHQTMPAKAYMYGLPYEYYKKYGIRRYGFHGTSHRYVSRRACDILGVDYASQRIISAHIGNGGSVTAIRDGKSVENSMGLTPLEGLLMGTRTGDIDGGALTYLMEKENIGPRALNNILNKKSGILGVSGVSSDMRELTAAAKSGNKRAQLAFDMYNYMIKKYVGAYAAVLGGVDILIFTGGVGENQDETRQAICENMEYMGLLLDVEKNKLIRGKEAVISAPESKVKAMVVPTNEELMIAMDTVEILSQGRYQ
ncbi:MAG: acetate kinase [Bacteroidales bacterium]|nr:acetate kinase [Bacteroidales bacterium]